MNASTSEMFSKCFDRVKVITILSKLSLFWIFLSRKNLDLYSKCEIYFILFHNSEIYTINNCLNRRERERKEKKEKEDPVSTWLISFKDAHCEKTTSSELRSCTFSRFTFWDIYVQTLNERAAISVWFSKITLQCLKFIVFSI